MKPTKKPGGFAAMSAERRREIAAMGGKKAHQLGRAHQFNSETAKRAGRLGAAARRAGAGK